MTLTGPTLTGPRRAPASGAAPKQLVVFIHGYGANGADLISLSDWFVEILPDAEFVAPDAPEAVDGVPGGRQWFPLFGLDFGSVSAGVRGAAPALDAFLDAELARLGLEDKDLALVGFSQGAMLALQAGLRRKAAPALIVGYSGALLDTGTLRSEIKTYPPVFLAHGTADDIVPAAATEAGARVLADLGLGVATHMTPGLAHSIDNEALHIAGAMMRDAFAGVLDLPPGVHSVSSTSHGGARES